MPDLGHELHNRRLKGVFGRYSNINNVFSTLIRSVRWALEDALEVSEIIKGVGTGCGLGERLEQYAGMGIFLNILNLLDETAVSVGRHGAVVKMLYSAWAVIEDTREQPRE